jgi:hypothetical protein
MSTQWSDKDTASNSVLWAVKYANLPANSVNRDAFYGNSTVGAWKNNNVAMSFAMGQFGVSTAEEANSSGEGSKVAHTGWAVRRAFTGPIDSVTVAAGGTNYKNTDTIRITTGGLTGLTANATGTVTTNATGGIVSITITSGGSGYVAATRANSAFVFANATGGSTITGAGANLVAVAGGRAGRVQYETIVAFGMANNGTSDDSFLPQA